MWQAEADKELTLSAWPATAVGEQTLTLANRRYSTVLALNLFILDFIETFNRRRMYQSKPKPHKENTDCKKVLGLCHFALEQTPWQQTFNINSFIQVQARDIVLLDECILCFKNS